MPIKAKPTAAEWLSLIADNATRLRGVGVLSVVIDGVSFVLAAAEASAPVRVVEDDAETDDLDPMNDPQTYGRRRVPGYTIEQDDRMSDT